MTGGWAEAEPQQRSGGRREVGGRAPGKAGSQGAFQGAGLCSKCEGKHGR